jgi:hypothetical protein
VVAGIKVSGTKAERQRRLMQARCDGTKPNDDDDDDDAKDVETLVRFRLLLLCSCC